MSELKKRYGLFTAICMVVGIVIGSGVFFKAQTILQITNGNMMYGVVAWVVGGAIMLFCVLAFAVMAQKYEKVNGIVDYAEATIGHKYAYFVGWFMSIILYPTLTSVLAWLSARYTLTFICSVNPNFAMTISAADGGCVVGPECFVLALLLLVLSYALNVLSPKISGKVQVSATVIKLIPLLLMAIVGTIYGLTHDFGGASASAGASMLAQNFSNRSGDLSILFSAVVATAFAYEGWIVATSINSELKNSKRNLPIALIAGSLIIIAVYIFYFIGVSGGAPMENLIEHGATFAFTNIFGNVFGNILNLFVAVSCMGTLNGLMLGCVRGPFSVATRNVGPKPHVFKEVDRQTNMPVNSGVLGLLMCALWFTFFYGANLTPNGWFGFFNFDSSELPICTTYAIYIPIFIAFMVRAKDVGFFKRFVLPSFAILGSAFIIFAAIYAHGIAPYKAAAAEGKFACPILAYLIVFAAIMGIGFLFVKKKGTKAEK